MDKITVESFKEGLVTSSFEMLDVNKDNVIDEKDLTAAEDSKIKSDIQKLLDTKDEDPALDGDLDLDGLDDKKNDVKAATVNQLNAAANVTGAAGQLPAGYENVDVSNLDGKTLDELNNMLAKINNNITLITKRMSELQTEYDALQADISRLETENANLETQMSGPLGLKRAEEANKAENEGKLAQEQEALNVKIEEYEQALRNLAIKNEQIRTQQWFEQLDYENRVKNVSDAAIHDYDPEKDGDDFEAYYLQKMSNVGCTVFSGLTRLNQQAEVYATEAGTRLKAVIDQTAIVAGIKRTLDSINTRISGYDAQIRPLQDKINSNNATIQSKRNLQATNRAEYNSLNTALTSENAKKTVVQNKIASITNGGGLSAKDILALISRAEKDLAKKNNVDLTTCYAAKGQQDGKWHLYFKNSGTSIARQYGKGQGYDIIAYGNGYVNNLKEVEGGKAVYYFTAINEDMTDGEVDCKYCAYTTSSPLSFDVDGDGVHTTTDTVNFDIDGDGELDVINNSAEWVLAFDKDHNGVAGENGSELFGDNTDLDGDGQADGYKDGFEALKALAKKEGLIGDDDTVLNEDDIALLTEKYGLSMTNGYGGEAKSLAELGITEINLAQTDKTTLENDFDGQQNDVMTQEGATFKVNGETRTYADIWHSKKGTVTSNSNTTPEVVKEAATNNPELTLQLNEQGIIALKGKVDYRKIFNSVTNKVGTPEEAQEKIRKYHEKLEEEQEAEKAEELKKEQIVQEAKDKQIQEQKLKEQKLKEQK